MFMRVTIEGLGGVGSSSNGNPVWLLLISKVDWVNKNGMMFACVKMTAERPQ